MINPLVYFTNPMFLGLLVLVLVGSLLFFHPRFTPGPRLMGGGVAACCVIVPITNLNIVPFAILALVPAVAWLVRDRYDKRQTDTHRSRNERLWSD